MELLAWIDFHPERRPLLHLELVFSVLDALKFVYRIVSQRFYAF